MCPAGQLLHFDVQEKHHAPVYGYKGLTQPLDYSAIAEWCFF
jgi:hypothetical protein